jgi:hypothetical protein
MTHMNIWRINHSRNIYVHTRGYQISDPKYSRRWKKLKLNESKEVITYRCRRFKWPGTKKKKWMALAALCEFNYSGQALPAFRGQERQFVFVSAHNTPLKNDGVPRSKDHKSDPLYTRISTNSSVQKRIHIG